MVSIPWLAADSVDFPPTEQAMAEPNGLLAAGGDLSPQRILNAYRHGIFPWYSDHQPILWWSPDPRLVFFPHLIHISRSLHKLLKKNVFSVTFDRDFAAVIEACAAPRAPEYAGTWITAEMIEAYENLHRLGHAHSVEVWQDQEIVGGVYGIAIGRVFFGESMFSRRSNASKIALVYLAEQLQRWGFKLIDCQVESEHLITLGAQSISRREFETLLQKYTNIESGQFVGRWTGAILD